MPEAAPFQVPNALEEPRRFARRRSSTMSKANMNVDNHLMPCISPNASKVPVRNRPRLSPCAEAKRVGQAFAARPLGSFDLLTPRTSPRPSSYRSVAVNMRVDNLIPLNNTSRPHRNFARQRRNHASATILRARLHRRCVEFGWRTPEGRRGFVRPAWAHRGRRVRL